MRIGFPITHKENEGRRALVPCDLPKIADPSSLVFEAGYGSELGFDDSAYTSSGARIGSHSDVLSCEVIVDAKVGDADYLSDLHDGTTIFGWVHATQNRDITDKLVDGRLTAYAWEKMFSGGRHVFWRNNELAGEAAILHAFLCWGRMPYECSVAVIGKGNTARGAMRMLDKLGARVYQFDRRTEGLLRDELPKFDAVVNCVLWDVSRDDHIISRADLASLRPGALVVDVSCDRHGGIETSIPTTIDDPTYMVDGIMHYAVDHTPALFYKTFSRDNSSIVCEYINQFLSGEHSRELDGCLIVKDGVILDEEIIKHQGR